MIPADPVDPSLQHAATAPPVAPLLQSATTAPPPVYAAIAPLLQEATTAPPLQETTTNPPLQETTTATTTVQDAATTNPPLQETTTYPPPDAATATTTVQDAAAATAAAAATESDPPPVAATATKSDPPPDAATATTTVQDAAATATTRKRGRKRNANFLSADNTGGTNLGDSVAERRKLTPRTCVNKKQEEQAKSPQRKKTKGRRLEQSMENGGEGEVHDDNEDGKEASQLQDGEEEVHDENEDGKEASQLQDDVVEEEDDDQDEEDEEDEDEEEEDVGELTPDDLEIIQQNKEVIDVDADDAVDFDAAAFSAKNKIEQDQILKSTDILLNINFLPLSFFIHSTDNFLICAYLLCVLNFSVFLNFSKLQTELIFFDFFCFSELSKTKKYTFALILFLPTRSA